MPLTNLRFDIEKTKWSIESLEAIKEQRSGRFTTWGRPRIEEAKIFHVLDALLNYWRYIII
jgi:hypothetical protein